MFLKNNADQSILKHDSFHESPSCSVPVPMIHCSRHQTKWVSFPPWFPGLFRNKTLFKSLQVFTMAQRSNAEVWVCVAPISLSLHACPYVSVSVILRAVNHHRGNTGALSLRSMRIWLVSATEQKLRKKKNQKIRWLQLFFS